MRLNRLLQILDDWSRWMRVDSHQLNFPNKSILLSTGGTSSLDEFEHMLEVADNNNVKIVDALIDSLPKNQKRAIYSEYLRMKKTTFHERDLSLAIDNLLTWADKRIYE